MGRKKNNKSSVGELKPQAAKGLEGFEQFYSLLWGDRWLTLKSSLLSEKLKPSLAKALSKVLKTGFIPEKFNEYLIDEASVVAAIALKPQNGLRHLDLCAAPGGKSLSMISLAELKGEFTLNEYSENRRQRLLRVIREHLDEQTLKSVTVRGGAGERFGLKYKNSFERVLVDAPCSGEHFQLQHPEQISTWSKKSSVSLATRQMALLCSGFDCLVAEGRLVYSTCSLSRLENEELIEKFLKKRTSAFEFDEPLEINIGLKIERAKHGYYILPDVNNSSGPIYFCMLGKRQG